MYQQCTKCWGSYDVSSVLTAVLWQPCIARRHQHLFGTRCLLNTQRLLEHGRRNLGVIGDPTFNRSFTWYWERDIVTATTVAVSSHPVIPPARQMPSLLSVDTTNDHLISPASDPRVRRRRYVRTPRHYIQNTVANKSRNYCRPKQEAQLLQGNSASAAHVYLRWLTGGGTMSGHPSAIYKIQYRS